MQNNKEKRICHQDIVNDIFNCAQMAYEDRQAEVGQRLEIDVAVLENGATVMKKQPIFIPDIATGISQIVLMLSSLQDDEMSYATGRHMCQKQFSHSYEVDEIVGMVRLVYKNRVSFYSGKGDLAPGLTVHRIGGHTHGMQCVRVWTKRGWMVLASDTSHYYEHFEKRRAYTTMFNVGEALQGYAKLEALADSNRHIIPGHDPLVIQRYPAASQEMAGIVARLDVEPSYG